MISKTYNSHIDGFINSRGPFLTGISCQKSQTHILLIYYRFYHFCPPLQKKGAWKKNKNHIKIYKTTTLNLSWLAAVEQTQPNPSNNPGTRSIFCRQHEPRLHSPARGKHSCLSGNGRGTLWFLFISGRREPEPTSWQSDYLAVWTRLSKLLCNASEIDLLYASQRSGRTAFWEIDTDKPVCSAWATRSVCICVCQCGGGGVFVPIHAK